MNRNLLILLSTIITFIGGCTLIPKYTRPASPVPVDWPKGEAYHEMKSAPSVPTPSELTWREFFTDERLQFIIESALNNNIDLRLAALNVEKARALYGIRQAELLPPVQAAGRGSKERMPADLSSSGSAMTTQRYDVNVGISSWEIDFFGRIRSLKDQALEEYLATDQARRSTQILLVSATASAYLTLAADRENLKLVTSTLETQQDTYKLIRKRYDVGLASELDLRRAQSQVDVAMGDLARYTQLAAQDENALNLLIGIPIPKAFLPVELDSVSHLKEISPGVSSELLLRRPDVMAAEHRLKAANANIGAARAAFFPNISLTTAIGTASVELSGLFKNGQSTWSFIPQSIIPIFDARTWSAYDATKVESKIALAQYEKAIQAAFREVADALAVYGTMDQQIAAQQSNVDALAETYRLSNARYTKGIDSYLSVLDAQRSLYSAQQGLIALRLARITNLVAFYKAMGGGA